MRTVSMSGSLRANVGKKDATLQRNEKKVPCVLYGGKEQVHFATDEKSFKKIVFTPEICFVKINIAGKEHDAILQDIQYHPTTDNILHADFLELIPGKQIVMGVPVKTEGVAPGILQGGKLIMKYRKLKVKALSENMPESIVINIDGLNIGSTVKVSELKCNNYAILESPNSVVATVRVTRLVEETPVAGATAAAPAAAAPAAAAPAAAAPAAKK